METTKNIERGIEIREFIITELPNHPKDISRFTAETFAISRPAALRHIHRLIDEGKIIAEGVTSNRIYSLAPLAEVGYEISLSEKVEEDVVWRELILPQLVDIKPNVLSICQYGLTEMVNNVIDHSEGKLMTVGLVYKPNEIRLYVSDDGIGIFKKIRDEWGYPDTRVAALELSKGKLTTDPEDHTGEGIFFASRMFDRFIITSEDTSFIHDREKDDWFLDDDDPIAGTSIGMFVQTDSEHSTREIQDRFTEDNNGDFSKTQVLVGLSRYGDENVISRSQAKRLLARLEKFNIVVLDFKGVEEIGRAFTDEIFRVYKLDHPKTLITAINTTDQIDSAIATAISADNQQPPT